MAALWHHGGEIYDKTVAMDYSVNTNPLGLPPSVKEALSADFAYAERYPDTECRALKQALAEKYGLPESFFLCGNGASELFQLIVRAAAPASALVTAPTFSGYEKALRDSGVSPAYHRLEKERGFSLTERFLEDLKAGPDLVFLCQPNNPNGSTVEPLLMEKIVEVCRERRIRLIVDECFLEFVDGAEALTARRFLRENPFVTVVSAFTKIYAMPGIRLGYLMTADEAFLAAMKRAQSEWSVSGAAQTAGLAALSETAYVEEAKAMIRAERQILTDGLRTLGLKVYPSEVNYLLFEADRDVAGPLLEKGILIRRCANYEGLDEHFFRIAVKKPEENRVFLEAIREILTAEGA